MKIIGINCSPRRGKSTFQSLTVCMEGVKEVQPGAETEIIELAPLKIEGCRACSYCKNKLACNIDDDFKELIPGLSDPDLAGIIIGTPVYFGGMTSQCKALLDRSVMFRRNGFIFRNCVGGVIAVGGVRNGGQELTIQNVQSAMFLHDMVVVSEGGDTSHFGGTLWNAEGKGVEGDEFGLKTARNLGMRVAEIAGKLK